MVDFTKLLNAKAGEAKKPKVLMAGNYPGVITRHELLPAPEGKDYQTIIRFHLRPTGWPEEAQDDDKTQDMGNGPQAIDLSKRQLRRDFYDSSLYRLDEFIRSCGVEANGRSYSEVLPELTGVQVLMSVEQYMNQRTGEFGNQIGNLVGQPS